MDSFDDMSVLKEELKGYDSFLCTLGSLTKRGKDEFRKVDYTYPKEFAAIGESVGIKYYGLLSSVGANAKSCLLYVRTKGEVENVISEF